MPMNSEHPWMAEFKDDPSLARWSDFYADHISRLCSQATSLLEGETPDSKSSFRGLVIAAGELQYYHADDRPIPFKPAAHFLHWAPITTGTDHWVLFKPGQKPHLLFFSPNDYWHEPAQFPTGALGTAVTWEKVTSHEIRSQKAFEYFGFQDSLAFIGPNVALPQFAGIQVNPPELIKGLNFFRSYKSQWEFWNLCQATRLGIKGHKAALDAFEQGASEREIYRAFLAAVGVLEHELPYSPIVALGEKGNFLHYESKRPNVKSKCLLLDAGASFLGYASDITRTWIQPSLSVDDKALKAFLGLLEGVDRLQQRIVAKAVAGQSFFELHKETLLETAGLAVDAGLVKTLPSTELKKLAVGRLFLPHGLGHMLGLQVHDVAGHQINLSAENIGRGAEYSVLRNSRVIEAGHVFTIEPGFYFSEMLLKAFESQHPEIPVEHNLFFDLMNCGGIRVEDNLYISPQGPINLTRELWPAF